MPEQPAAAAVDVWWIPGGPEHPRLRRARIDRLLRTVLGRQLGESPDTLRFGREPRGRPFLLASAATPAPPEFNLSDTRGGTVVAVSTGLRVGIDMEREDRRVSHRALARRYFAAAEAEALEALEDAAARTTFLALWTAKEAACKATGTGIYGWLEAWQFAVAGGDPQPLRVPEGTGGPDAWSFRRIHPAPGYTAVIAAPGAIGAVRLHEAPLPAA